MVTGGFAPNIAGWVRPFAGMLVSSSKARKHRVVTDAVHAEGSKIALQILHAGRYAYHPFAVAPSAIKSPISPFRPRELSASGVERQVKAFVRCAELAREAGYDGVEVMGSEGYLINEFLTRETNHRDDRWGGDYVNRMRFPVEIVERTRERVGRDFIIIYRLSMLDLVPGGSSWDEVVLLAKAIEAAGATLINTGIGWHEARIPTIATSVPRGAFAWVTKKLKGEVRIPLIATNRINMPDVAEKILADGCADMVSMARPLLADAEFVNKAASGRTDEINTCIACNQACLDHVFENKLSSCLVNPRACHETELVYRPIAATPGARKRVAVVGAGPAGLAAATTLAERGHDVTLFDADDRIGGQLNMAKVVPGKEEFAEMLRYFSRRLEVTGVDVRLGTRVGADDLAGRGDERDGRYGGYDKVIIATGVRARQLAIPGIDHPKVLSYIDVLRHQRPVGPRVAIIGAGGIGFDVAEFLVQSTPSPTVDLDEWLAEWGIGDPSVARGGVDGIASRVSAPLRAVTLLQRKSGKPGAGLGKTTGWIHRATLKMKDVKMLGGVNYERIDDRGLLISNGERRENPTWLDVDSIVICAGQESNNELSSALTLAGVATHVIGGADKAVELDAKRAIDQACRLAALL